jgi:hypothetical protein
MEWKDLDLIFFIQEKETAFNPLQCNDGFRIITLKLQSEWFRLRSLKLSGSQNVPLENFTTQGVEKA